MDRALRSPQHRSTLGFLRGLCKSVDVQWSLNVTLQPSAKVWEDPSASVDMSRTAHACSEDLRGQPFAKGFYPWRMPELSRLARQTWHWLVHCRAEIRASAIGLPIQIKSCCFFLTDFGKSLCLCFFSPLNNASVSPPNFLVTSQMHGTPAASAWPRALKFLGDTCTLAR